MHNIYKKNWYSYHQNTIMPSELTRLRRNLSLLLKEKANA